MEKHMPTPNKNSQSVNYVFFQEAKMGSNKSFSGRFWTAIVLTLIIIGQVQAVSAHPNGNNIQQEPGCFMQTRVDPRDYYPIEGIGVPNAAHVERELVCFAGEEAAARQINIVLAGQRSVCALEVLVDPRDYYPIEGIGVPAGRHAVLREVCN